MFTSVPQTTLDYILTRLGAIEPKASTPFIAIDGRGGSGKSSLAQALCEQYPKLQLVPLDDFPCREDEQPFHPLGTQSQISTARVVEQVIRPLSQGRSSVYFKTGWWKEEVTQEEEAIAVEAGRPTLLEGCRSLSKVLRPFIDFAIWVETPLEEASSRGMERDGGQAHNIAFWEQVYIPAETRYLREEEPQQAAHLIVSNSTDSPYRIAFDRALMDSI